MTIGEVVGYIAAVFVLATFWMKTMVPLRIAGIVSNVFFIGYGILAHAYPPLILHIVLLPLNALRLYQMQQLIRQVRQASHGDLSLQWLKPFMTARATSAGDVLFRKGDVADEMFFTLSGRYRLKESGIALADGVVVGEFGLLAPERTRTQSLECVEGGKILQIGYGQVEQLFFQNPQFGFFFLKLIAARLFDNVARLESELARARAAGSPKPA